MRRLPLRITSACPIIICRSSTTCTYSYRVRNGKETRPSRARSRCFYFFRLGLAFFSSFKRCRLSIMSRPFLSFGIGDLIPIFPCQFASRFFRIAFCFCHFPFVTRVGLLRHLQVAVVSTQFNFTFHARNHRARDYRIIASFHAFANEMKSVCVIVRSSRNGHRLNGFPIIRSGV